jgi:ribosomal protein S12 methylthiotransferase
VRKERKPKVYVITMGCAKNTVDSEQLMAQLKLSGIEMSPTLEGADIAVINTCGFIEAAKQESIDTIIAQVKRKGKGTLKKVYAIGCLTERYREEIIREIPEVDEVFGTRQMKDVVERLGGRYKYDLLGERVLTTPGHFAYLKISEGCDHPCSFCAIPLMRGKHVTKPMGEVIAEAKLLAERGVKELVVIGQDTTSYGQDLYSARRLPRLLEQLADVEGIEWIRLMYAYPSKFPHEVLEVMARQPRLCKYLDIPLQHVAEPVLRSMRRGISKRALQSLIGTIRDRVPEIALRTTFIVGYPNETAREFDELLDFVQKTRFDRLGVFTYSQEDRTAAFPLGDPVSGEEKERRKAVLMEAQREISERNNTALIGTQQKVLVDRLEGDAYIGRTERDAPEIDNEVFIPTDAHLSPGSFYTVDIVDAYEYDLVASVPGSIPRTGKQDAV